MFNKKVWGSLVMAAVLLVTVGCGSDAKSTSEEKTDSAAKVYKIGISQIVEHPALDATRQGFIAALKDAGFVEGENLKIDYNNAQNDQTNNLSIAQKIAGDKDDLVLAIATPSAQAVVQQVKDTPVLFAAVTDPIAAKLVDKLDQPSGNVTGASDSNPEAIAQLMKFISTNFKEVKKVGLIINEGETNAIVMADKAKTELAKYGIELVKAPVTNTSEVKQAADSLVGRVDAFYVTLDNMVVNGFDAIVQTANKKHIPLFTSDRDTVENGSFATVGFKYYDHGYQVGQMAVDILKNGKKTNELKITVPDKLDLILNLKAAEAQGIAVTDQMKAEVKDPANNIIQ
ncbi:protein of unknown function DUF534 [Paenibacillus curdlanolyticus YK9]|uniref:ABC transporter substrate binding protein n=1 Tax=Paenibacillus curdlanolyticus YK9 TaxID=717606 RepID=E0I8I9_9BACL|nr:ABC transporter substrate-binding protein [Paenibacillus curdlanolyticus]EFM11494.1 protein of unknown function DUF534 [Paenibacillus curdlanolyticus YK9]